MRINLINMNIPKDISVNEIDDILEIKQNNNKYSKFMEFIILLGLILFLSILVFLFIGNLIIVTLIMLIITIFIISNLSSEEAIRILIKDGILIKEEPEKTIIQIGVKNKDKLPKTITHNLIEIEKIKYLTVMEYERKYFLNLIDIHNNNIFVTADNKEENILFIKTLLETYITSMKEDSLL